MKLQKQQWISFREFSKDEDNEDFSMLNELPAVVNEEQNEELNRKSRIQEVKKTVMGMNRHSTRGPYGMTGAFF